MTGKPWSIGCLIAASILAACADEEHLCDPDQTFSQGVCYDPPTEDETFAHFGDTCTDDTGCEAPTSFCVKLPGAASGYCTATGCLEDASVCPADWVCTDLSSYGPGLPSICATP